MLDSFQISPDDIRSRFAQAMSDMYRAEVPLYGTLLEIVESVNATCLAAHPDDAGPIAAEGGIDRLSRERHGAIRLGTAAELSMIRRIFAIMGMEPVSYYDLTASGIPVHSTAFRPVADIALARAPFRVFTSLLRLDAIANEALRAEAEQILARRDIFPAALRQLVSRAEAHAGLTSEEADAFVAATVQVFRWHERATVDAATYNRLKAAHPLIADIVCFRGPHINHLTPRTLDIDAAQTAMIARGLPAKTTIEGPPKRRCPILLRQTSFRALEEPVFFSSADATAPAERGSHTARFGEIEQRGVALTPRGRALYDTLLQEAHQEATDGPDYPARLNAIFTRFPDDWEELREQGLAYFRYLPRDKDLIVGDRTLADLLASGDVYTVPVIYEDFLPVSAAGIFQSNLGAVTGAAAEHAASRTEFEKALGAPIMDEMTLYRFQETASLRTLGLTLPDFG